MDAALEALSGIDLTQFSESDLRLLAAVLESIIRPDVAVDDVTDDADDEEEVRAEEEKRKVAEPEEDSFEEKTGRQAERG